MATNPALMEALYQILCGGHVPAGAARGAGSLGWRKDKAAAADPQNVWQTLYTIASGYIIITGLFGIRTVIQAGGASTMQFRWDDGVAPTVLDAGTLAVTGHAVGTLYSLTGDVTDPIQAGAGGVPINLGKIVATSLTYSGGVLVGAGTIDVTMTAAAGTGSTQYILTYIPLSDAVTVV